MIETIGRIGAALLLGAACAGVCAQTCRDDIPATAPDSRFTDNGNGTVTDAGTGLMWKQCAEGQSGADCAGGAAVGIAWGQALRAAAAADFAGHADWRLPNKNELESLVERSCAGPAINARYFPNTPSTPFWSSSPSSYASYHAWYVHFANGKVHDGYKYEPNRVRLVRAGQ